MKNAPQVEGLQGGGWNIQYIQEAGTITLIDVNNVHKCEVVLQPMIECECSDVTVMIQCTKTPLIFAQVA